MHITLRMTLLFEVADTCDCIH